MRARAIRTLALLAGAAGLGACRESPAEPGASGAFQPAEARALPGNGNGKDEDPSILRARNGRIFLAWFSDRTGSGDIYITSTTDGREWTPAVRVTTSADGDFYPSLMQDEAGTIHLAWFRWSAPFRGHIWYNSSADGLTWDPAREVQVTTTEAVDDWVPSLVQAPDGGLLVYFVSALRGGPGASSDIYVARRPAGETRWQVQSLPGLNSGPDNDHLPAAGRSGTTLSLVWVRYPAGAAAPWLSPRSDLYYATSADGLSWSAPRRVTTDAGDVANLYPDLSADAEGALTMTWLSTRKGAPAVYQLPLSRTADYPGGVSALDQLPAGYSHRITTTPTPGISLAAWVQGPDGSQDIYYRVIRR